MDVMVRARLRVATSSIDPGRPGTTGGLAGEVRSARETPLLTKERSSESFRSSSSSSSLRRT